MHKQDIPDTLWIAFVRKDAPIIQQPSRFKDYFYTWMHPHKYKIKHVEFWPGLLLPFIILQVAKKNSRIDGNIIFHLMKVKIIIFMGKINTNKKFVKLMISIGLHEFFKSFRYRTGPAYYCTNLLNLFCFLFRFLLGHRKIGVQRGSQCLARTRFTKTLSTR